MKKILSLLSVMTISATALPATIAASPYQNQENKLENTKINYQQTDNLETLIRVKRRDVLNYEYFTFQSNRLHFTFSKARWNQIKDAYNKAYTINDFTYKLIDILNDNVWQDTRSENWSSRSALATVIWNKFYVINNTISNSNFNNFRLVTNHKQTFYDFYSVGEPDKPDEIIKENLIAGSVITGSAAACAGIGAGIGFLSGGPFGGVLAAELGSFGATWCAAFSTEALKKLKKI